MAQDDVSQPIYIILDGTNYSHWVQAFQNFLRDRKLWKYITGDITILVAVEGESSKKFNTRFKEWDSDNHKIIT